MKNFSKVLWGLVLVSIGVIIGLKALNIIEINIFFKGWWTLFIIVPCFISLFDSRESKVGNFIGIVIGVALLLATRNIIRFDLLAKLIVPFILIVVGLSIMFNEVIKRKVTEKVNKTNPNENSIIATFSEQKVNFDNQEFEKTDIEAIFGGASIDLRKANLKDETAIKAVAIFGGVDILLPQDVNVKVKSVPIFGGVSNKISNNNDNKKTVYIEATAVFGGVTIK